MFGTRFLLCAIGVAYTVAGPSTPQMIIARMLQESGNKELLIDSIWRLGELAEHGSPIAQIPQLDAACEVVVRSHIELISFANARLYDEGIASNSIQFLTPFANLHRICGSQLNPVLKQAILKHKSIREAVGRNPRVVRLNGGASGAAVYEVAGMDPYYLILGGIKRGVISQMMYHLFPPSRTATLFTKNVLDDLWDFDQDYLASSDSVVLRAAGRQLGLSVVQSIPLGHTLSHEVLDLLLGPAVDGQADYVRQGFRDIIPDDIHFRLDEFISPLELGMILRGSTTPITVRDLQSALTVINQHPTEPVNEIMRWLFRFVEGRLVRFLKLVTNCKVAPLGGPRLITPRMKVIVRPYTGRNTSIKADEHNHILKIRRYPTAQLLEENLMLWMD